MSFPPSVMSMPTARIMKGLFFVPARWDSQEMGKRVQVIKRISITILESGLSNVSSHLIRSISNALIVRC